MEKNKRRWRRSKDFFHLSLRDILKLMVQCLALHIIFKWDTIDSLLPSDTSILLKIFLAILLSQIIIIFISDKLMGNKYHAVHKAD